MNIKNIDSCTMRINNMLFDINRLTTKIFFTYEVDMYVGPIDFGIEKLIDETVGADGVYHAVTSIVQPETCTRTLEYFVKTVKICDIQDRMKKTLPHIRVEV